MTTRTIDEALAKFELLPRSAGNGDNTACETSLLNWVWGEPIWSDALACAHRLIRNAMINHNDAEETTKEQREEAVRLGVDGALDTWWIPVEVIISKMAVERGTDPSKHERLVALLKGVAAWKLNKERADLRGADLRGAYLRGAYLQGADLQGAYLRGADLRGAYLRGADLRGAYLRGAYLRGADLQGAYLRGADGYSDVIGLDCVFGLEDAIGEPATLPSGWKFENGIIVPEAK